jgi:hypothetical protein
VESTAKRILAMPTRVSDRFFVYAIFNRFNLDWRKRTLSLVTHTA